MLVEGGNNAGRGGETMLVEGEIMLVEGRKQWWYW